MVHRSFGGRRPCASPHSAVVLLEEVYQYTTAPNLSEAEGVAAGGVNELVHNKAACKLGKTVASP